MQEAGRMGEHLGRGCQPTNCGKSETHGAHTSRTALPLSHSNPLLQSSATYQNQKFAKSSPSRTNEMDEQTRASPAPKSGAALQRRDD